MTRPDPKLRYLMPAIAGYEPGTAEISDLEPSVDGFAVRAAVAPPGPARRTAAPSAHPVVELEIDGLRALPAAEVRAMEERSRNPTHWQVVNLLCDLEPIEVRSAFLTHGKTHLYAGRARALR